MKPIYPSMKIVLNIDLNQEKREVKFKYQDGEIIHSQGTFFT